MSSGPIYPFAVVIFYSLLTKILSIMSDQLWLDNRIACYGVGRGAKGFYIKLLTSMQRKFNISTVIKKKE